MVFLNSKNLSLFLFLLLATAKNSLGQEFELKINDRAKPATVALEAKAGANESGLGGGAAMKIEKNGVGSFQLEGTGGGGLVRGKADVLLNPLDPLKASILNMNPQTGAQVFMLNLPLLHVTGMGTAITPSDPNSSAQMGRSYVMAGPELVGVLGHLHPFALFGGVPMALITPSVGVVGGAVKDKDGSVGFVTARVGASGMIQANFNPTHAVYAAGSFSYLPKLLTGRMPSAVIGQAEAGYRYTSISGDTYHVAAEVASDNVDVKAVDGSNADVTPARGYFVKAGVSLK